MLSSGVPTKPDIAKDLLKPPVVGRKSMEEFIKSKLVEKSVGFHDPIKCNKLKTFAGCEVKKKVNKSNES